MDKSILITGGAGFIGAHLVNKLFNKGYKIKIIDNFNCQIHGDDYKKSHLYKMIEGKCEIIKADICDYSVYGPALKDVEQIFHLAAETGTGQSMYELNSYFQTNVLGFATLLQALQNFNNKVKKIVLASSRAVYGEGKYYCENHGIQFPLTRSYDDMKKGDFSIKCTHCGKEMKALPTDENSDLNPLSFYALTKKNQEEMLKLYSDNTGIDYVIFRFQNVYGPGQSLKNPYTGIISIFSNLVRNNKSIEIYEDGNESRDFVFIDDLIKILELSIVSKRDLKQIINIGSGTSTSVMDIARSISNHLRSTSNYEITGSFRKGDIRSNYSDNKKLLSTYGNLMFTSIDSGLKIFTQWVISQKIEDSLYKKSIDELAKRGLYVKK
ncbi:MAG: NAD-dependent epimerase/dehydratase family protein [Acholeplasma sp.]|nr:NAD-dependent epimerase/dehydratase family protein [Acholeplasma sp.]